MGAATSGDHQQSTDVSIKLDKKTHLYLPGETVSGTVSFDEYRHRKGVISIDLIGEVGYRMTNSRGGGMTATTDYSFPFFGASKAPIRDGEKFDLHLDENLPPSVNLVKGTFPYIRYILQVNLSKTNKHRHWIIVCPRVITSRSAINPVYFDALHSTHTRLLGSINLESVLPGEKFEIDFKINNPNHEQIKYIDGRIVMRAKFSGGEFSEKVMNVNIHHVHDTDEEEITGLVPLAIPFNYFPPTFSYTNDTHTFHVTIDYLVILEAHIKNSLKTLKAKIPLMVGFDPDKIEFNEVSVADQRRLSSTRMRLARALQKH
jgi:hypothetical protein